MQKVMDLSIPKEKWIYGEYTRHEQVMTHPTNA